MPSKSVVPDGRASGADGGGASGDFGLIETIAYFRETGFALIDGHMDRLARSAAALEFAFDDAGTRAALADAAENAAHGALRMRLVLWRGGRLEVTSSPLAPASRDTVWRVAFAERRFHSAMPNLRHKTTRRDLYEDELAYAATTRNADEVIFLNERYELCEGARSNIFLRRDGLLLTPKLSCGLLPGVLRASLLASGAARETVLTRADLSKGELFMGNSVRGLVAGRLTPARAA
jgi:4-amino-4-deoxychorismate lyase